jgi:hypothetical protein
VQVRSEIFLEIAERILVHRVDVIDPAQLFHTKAAATGAAALSPEEKEEPLVPKLALAAFSALQDSVIDESLTERTRHSY